MTAIHFFLKLYHLIFPAIERNHLGIDETAWNILNAVPLRNTYKSDKENIEILLVEILKLRLWMNKLVLCICHRFRNKAKDLLSSIFFMEMIKCICCLCAVLYQFQVVSDLE